jgi:unsaturated rhamnogalacturonyl hydrolase
VLAALDAANSFFLADPRNAPNPSTNDCGWTRGTFMSGHMAHYAVTRNATLLAWAERWAEAHNYSCGGVWDDGNFFACGQAYAALYELAPADYKLSLAVTMHRAIANYANSSFFGQDWWWVDLLFMALPSWTRYGVLMGDDEILAQGLREFAATSDGGSNATAQPGLWDAESKLYWRDKTYIAQRAPNGNKVFWARGVGWASAALALTLEYLPPAHAAFPVLLQRLSDIAHALLPLQGADGMWRSSLLDADEYP